MKEIKIHYIKGEVDPVSQPPYLKYDLDKSVMIPLSWENVLDKREYMRRCPVCGCKELYRRKDIKQKWGLAIIIAAAFCSFVLFAMHYVIAAILLLILVFLIDAAVFFVVPDCIVCYKCCREYRKVKISKRVHKPWDLSIGEKYRSQ